MSHRPASSPSAGRSIKVSRANRADRVEAVLRHADATLERWFRQAKKRSAGALRHQVANLQVGLKKLSAGLERVEQGPRIAPAKRATRPPTSRKPASARKPKKAA